MQQRWEEHQQKKNLRMGKVVFLGVCKQAHSLFGKLEHQQDSYFTIAYWGRKVES